MDVINSSLHITEEVKSETDLRRACDRAEKAELQALQALDADPSNVQLRQDLITAAAEYDIAYTAWFALT